MNLKMKQIQNNKDTWKLTVLRKYIGKNININENINIDIDI